MYKLQNYCITFLQKLSLFFYIVSNFLLSENSRFIIFKSWRLYKGYISFALSNEIEISHCIKQWNRNYNFLSECVVKVPSNLISFERFKNEALFIFDHVLLHESYETIGIAWEDLTAHIAHRIAAAAAVSGPDGQLAELLPNCVLPSTISARGNANNLHVKLYVPSNTFVQGVLS